MAYADAVGFMEDRAAAIAEGKAAELIWLTEHPPLITAGTRAAPEDILDPGRFPVHWTGRGGAATYHGPGQRIAYVMLDVRARFAGDVRRFVATLEDVVIATLAPFGITAERRCGHPGLYVRQGGPDPSSLAKIAALGLRVRRGVSFHGLSINVSPDLTHFASIVACGDAGTPATSLAALGCPARFKDVDKWLLEAFAARLGPLAPLGSLQPGGSVTDAGDQGPQPAGRHEPPR